MNNPSLLLVYRIAKDGDEFAARCVCCDVNSPESWKRQLQWSGTSLKTGEQIKFRLSVSDYSGGPDGPPEVYGEEECMKRISKDNWIPVRVSQNGTYLRIEDIGGNGRIQRGQASLPCPQSVVGYFLDQYWKEGYAEATQSR